MRMVNNRFPEKASYGFELVDSWFTPSASASIENLRRIKSTEILAGLFAI